MNNSSPLTRKFYQRDPVVVAQELLGKLLVRELDGEPLVGRIVETEAYLAQGDPASHAARGKTAANASIFLDGGHAYIYNIHRYHCVDAVCQTVDQGGCVLIRALEPILGKQTMQSLREMNKTKLIDNPIQKLGLTSHKILKSITNGPGKICQAMAINKDLDGIDMTDSNSILKICSGEIITSEGITQSLSPNDFQIDTSLRIGISKAVDLPLRFTMAGSSFLSR